MSTSPSGSQQLPKASPFNAVTLGIRIQHVNGGRGTVCERDRQKVERRFVCKSWNLRPQERLGPYSVRIQTLIWKDSRCLIPTVRHQTSEMGAGPRELRTGCMKNFGPALLTTIWSINIINRIWFQMCFDYSLILSLWGSGQPSTTSNSVALIIYPKDPKNGA